MEVRRAAQSPDTLAPDGSQIRLLTAGKAASLVEVRLPSGAISRPVRHRTVEETWYFLAGEGRVWRRPPLGEAATVDVHAADCLLIPAGWEFQFAAGAEGLRFLCFTSPPWPGAEEAVAVPAGGLGAPTV